MDRSSIFIIIANISNNYYIYNSIEKNIYVYVLVVLGKISSWKWMTQKILFQFN